MKGCFPFAGLECSTLSCVVVEDWFRGYYVGSLRLGFSGVVIQHCWGSVSSVFVLGLAFGSAKGKWSIAEVLV